MICDGLSSPGITPGQGNYAVIRLPHGYLTSLLSYHLVSHTHRMVRTLRVSRVAVS